MANLTSRIKESGLRVTRARVAIMALLEKCASPLEAAMVRNRLRSLPVDLATVYRNLTRLEQAGLIKKINLAEAAAKFEAAGLPHHHHLVCNRCGLIEEIAGCEINKPPATRQFAAVIQHQLNFEGICKRCSIKH